MTTSIFDRYSRVIIVCTLLTCPFLMYGARSVVANKHSDIREWLPSNFRESREYNWFKQHFEGDQLVIVSWEGCTLENPRVLQFAERLRSHGSDASTTSKRLFREIVIGSELIEQIADLNSSPDAAATDFNQRLLGTLVGPDGKQTCVVCLLSDEGEVHYRTAIARIETVATEECRIPRGSLHLAGLPVENRAVDLEGEWTLLKLSALSGAVALAISWLFLRSWWLVLLVLFVSSIASVMSLAIVWYTGNDVDAFQMTMPSLVYVLTLSGAVHLINYWFDAIREGGPVRAADRAVARGCRPCVLAAGTTALGLVSLTTSNIRSVREFGIYAAAAILASLVVLLGLLPSVLEPLAYRMTRSSHQVSSKLESLAGRTAKRVIMHRNVILSIGLSLLVLSASSFRHIEPSLKLIRLFSPESELVRDYRWLESRLGPMVPLEIVLRIDNNQCRLRPSERLQLVREIEDEVTQLSEIGGAISLATFLPETTSLGDRSLIRTRILNHKLQKNREKLKETGYIADSRDAQQNDELWRISARAWSLNDLDYAAFLRRIQSEVEPILAEHRRRGVNGLSAVYTGIVPLITQAQRQLMNGLVESLAIAFVLIGAVMILLLRSVSAGLLAMIPNVFPVVFIFGSMALLGVSVDLGSMITAGVAMGVAVDDTVHFLTWFRRGLDDRLDRLQAIEFAYRYCAPAMIQTTAIAGIGLLMFMTSSFIPTRQFGLLMFLLLVAALLGDLLLLPALLAGPAGRFFSKTKRAQKA